MKPIIRLLSLWIVFIFNLSVTIHAGEKENQFVQAAMNGDIDRVEHFLKTEKIDLNAKDDQNRIALISALRRGQNGMAKFLIEKGASVNVKTNLVTPLIVTSWSGNLEITKILLKQGARL